MSDEALRALERAAAADPARTLEWATALERAGRADEALLALCRAIDRADVRDALAHVAPWDPALALDVPPIRRAPRVRWSASSPQRPRALQVCPHTVLTTARGQAHELRDPRDGAVRARLRHDDHLHWLDGERVVGLPSDGEPELLWWEAWGPASAEERAPRRTPRRPRRRPHLVRLPGGAAPLDAAALDRRARGLPLDHPHLASALPVERVRGAPGWWAAWPRSREDSTVGFFEAWASSRRAVVTLSSMEAPFAALFDLRTMARLGELDAYADAHDDLGTLLTDARERLLLVDEEGATRWTRRGLLPCVLGPEQVVARARGDGALVVLQRATGRARARLGDPAVDGAPVRLALARDTLVVGSGPLVRAWSAAGERRWEVDLREVDAGAAQVVDVAPLPGAVVVAFAGEEGGGWVCLEEGP